MRKTRNSNFEILRIISIFMIVLSHFSLYGNWHLNNISPSLSVKLLVFDPLGPVGATIFFIITGYFLTVKSLNVLENIPKTINKLKTIWTEVIFYSVLIFIICLSADITKFSFKSLLTSIFPVILNEYWFVTAYVLLILISPFMIKLIGVINKKEFQTLLLILVFFNFLGLANSNLITNLSTAIIGFCIGGYVKLYKKNLRIPSVSLLAFMAFVIYLLDLLSVYVMNIIGIAFGHTAHMTTYLMAEILATLVFLIFVQLKEFSNFTINSIASTVFASYLITESPNFREYLWNNIVNAKQFQYSVFLPVYALGIVTLTFGICFMIDKVRQYVFKLANNIWSKKTTN